jgi:hypothetical protein
MQDICYDGSTIRSPDSFQPLPEGIFFSISQPVKTNTEKIIIKMSDDFRRGFLNGEKVNHYPIRQIAPEKGAI